MGLQSLFGGDQSLGNQRLPITETLARYRHRNGDGIAERIVQRDTDCADTKRVLFTIIGNTAAARTWPLGTSLTVTNPKTGRSIVVRINDTGPWGIAYRMGARLDMAVGAARRIGMNGSQYVCVA